MQPILMQKDKQKKILNTIATKLVWLLILFLGKSARIQLVRRGTWNRLVDSKNGFLAVLWHGKMMLPIYVHRHLGITAMVSEHQDGEMIALSVHRLGYQTVRGSSTRGGTRAFRHMLKHLKKGGICTVMPDGPRGPRHQLKMGTILLAQLSGCPILPLTFAAKWRISLRSWDAFNLWWPLSRCALLYGKPIWIPRQASGDELEEWRIKVEQALNRLEEQADAFF